MDLLILPITNKDSGVSGTGDGKALRMSCPVWEWWGDWQEVSFGLPRALYREESKRTERGGVRSTPVHTCESGVRCLAWE